MYNTSALLQSGVCVGGLGGEQLLNIKQERKEENDK